MKHPDEPDKFMESEIELHQEIQELFVVADSPELYPILVQTSSMNSLLGMITHENTDISLSTVSLFVEIFDTDNLTPPPDDTDDEQQYRTILQGILQLLDNFLSLQGLELVTQNLTRLNEEESEEDAQGVANTLNLIENLLEYKPTIAVTVCKDTIFLEYLLKRVNKAEMDDNKFLASEV